MARKRPLDAVVPEQEALQSPRKRLQRAVFRVMSLERRRARAVSVEQMAQMVRQMQLNMAKLFVLLMVLVARLGSMESLFLQLPNMIQGLLSEQLGAFRSSFMESMEDMVRSVRQTEMQEPQAVSLPNGFYEPSSSREISQGLPETGRSSGSVKLRFVDADRPKDPLYTGCPVKWQNGKKAKVAIFENERQVRQGNLSKLQIEILPVHADFFTERGHEDFTKEEFNKHIHMYKGKESVLTTVNLRNGEAFLGSFFFTESSYRKNLRLAARVKRQDPAYRVQEAITDPFVVKDRRSELNEKSCLPSKEDPIYRLKKISQKGPRYLALAEKNITKVKHLMRQYHKDKSGLQELTGMKKEDWHTMIEHANMCDTGDEIYSCRVAEENCELLFNDFYDLVGTMTNGRYVPVSHLDQIQQLNYWKMDAYKRLEERENSGDLIPDYFMSNGHPVRAMPLNSDAGPSVQPRMTGQYPNYISAQQEFGEQHPFRQQNGFSQAKVLSSNEAPLFSQHTVHQGLGHHDPSMPNCHLPLGNILNVQAPFSGQPTIPSHNVIPEEDLITRTSLFDQQNGYLNSLTTDAPELGQHHPSMPQNGTPYCPAQRNILNGQRSFSGQPTIPSPIFSPVAKDDLITGAGLIHQHNGCLSSLVTDAPGTSCPVTDGLGQGSSSFNHATDDIWSVLSPIPEFVPQVNIVDQGFLQDNDAELPNSDIQFDGYEHDGGNL